MTNILAAMEIGILSTCILHFAKGMERQNIEFYDQVRAKISNTTYQTEHGTRKNVLYLIAMLVNNLIFLLVLWATQGGTPATYYTSMFGVGLIVLMVYSAVILKEHIRWNGYVGSIILLLGTLIVGIQSWNEPALQNSNLNYTTIWIIFLVWVAVGIIAIIITYKKGGLIATGLVFGIFTGAVASLDPVLKAISQSYGNSSGYFPSTVMGWGVFVFSFVLSIVNWFVSQWGFARKAAASVLVPAYNSMYVAFPIFIYAFALSGFVVSPTMIIGICIIAMGIVIMQNYKKQTPINKIIPTDQANIPAPDEPKIETNDN